MKKVIYIAINQQEYPVEITKKNMKRMIMKVEKDGKIKVSAARYFSDREILSFIENKKNWLEKTLRAVKIEQTLNSCEQEGHVYVFGKKKKVIKQKALNSSLTVKKDIFYYSLCHEEDLDILFKQYAKTIIEKKIMVFRSAYDTCICRNHHLQLPVITVRDMRSRWGSCTPSKGTIRISSRLIHYPEECLQYVLLHEYAHLLQANHSRAFYKIVQTYMPDYKEREKLLKGKSYL